MAHRGGDGGHGATRVDEQARVRVAAEALVPGPATQRASYGLPARKRRIATGPAAFSRVRRQLSPPSPSPFYWARLSVRLNDRPTASA